MIPNTGAWMPIFWGDYFGDTRHLTTEQHGAYLLLIGTYWRRGRPLPDDDKFLAKCSGMSGQKWIRSRQIVAGFFHIKDGEWHHKRVDLELLKSSNRQAAAIANGRAGGLAKSYLSTSTSTSISRVERTLDQNAKNDTEQAFEQFWSAYPRKTAKGSAREAFRKALTKSTLPSILAAIERQKPRWSDPKFIPHPATWLNAERWLDEGASVVPISQRHEVLLAGRIDTYRKSGYWGSDWGLKPPQAEVEQ